MKYEILREGNTLSISFQFLYIFLKLVSQQVDLAQPISIC